jgi:hypothetical protein
MKEMKKDYETMLDIHVGTRENNKSGIHDPMYKVFKDKNLLNNISSYLVPKTVLRFSKKQKKTRKSRKLKNKYKYKNKNVRKRSKNDKI